jgi:hypothetical protein
MLILLCLALTSVLSFADMAVELRILGKMIFYAESAHNSFLTILGIQGGESALSMAETFVQALGSSIPTLVPIF